MQRVCCQKVEPFFFFSLWPLELANGGRACLPLHNLATSWISTPPNLLRSELTRSVLETSPFGKAAMTDAVSPFLLGAVPPSFSTLHFYLRNVRGGSKA